MTHPNAKPGEDLGAVQGGQRPASDTTQKTSPAQVDTAKPSENLELQHPKNEQKLVDFGSDQSFPASDPPAHDIIKVKEVDAGNAGSQ